jgi:hypothetical protein
MACQPLGDVGLAGLAPSGVAGTLQGWPQQVTGLGESAGFR